MTPLRLLIADDHELVRHGLRRVIEDIPGWQICGEAVTGRQAVALARETRPHIVVMDIAMPELNGLEATRQICAAAPTAAVLILSMHESEELLRETRAAGARGYILKSDAGAALVDAVTALAAGKTFFTAGISPHARPGNPAETAALTPREREVVQLAAEGRSSKEIAVTLGISVKTCETHRTNILRKLGLRSVTDLVRYAIRNKIVEA
ncbi:MAG: response regulator transcription factor [Verrucomicrobia bacterium]|nr:response regulator transcription factor [Verrucomicrobiota bacterium]